MGRLIFDEPAWWQRPRWHVAAAAVAMTAAVAVWWVALAPAELEAIAPRVSNAPAVMAVRPAPPVEAIAPAPEAASAPAPSPPLLPALSTMVAPGVHVTPLSVPPGTEPVAAGPRAHDSEPEN
jgi:hypothetical protein